MDNQILKEIKEVRKLLSAIVGTSELPAKEKFSKEAIIIAAKEFRDLAIKRGEWINEHDISKIIKKAPYGSGKFIIEKFGFTNYFTRGNQKYFNRKDLESLSKELKKRNINMDRYLEFLNDKEKFDKYIENAKNQVGNKKRKRFRIPDGVKDITTYPYPPPSTEIITNHISILKEELQKYKLSEYIDIYNDSYAMFKYIYYFDRYINPELKKRCRKWCDDFNYANHAFKEALKSYEVRH
jgi:hypothetical protein